MPIFKNNLITSKSATNVHFADNDMVVTLSDGTHLRVALEKITWLHWLLDATPAQRAEWTLDPGGFAIYWEELDDGFEIEHLLNMPDLHVQVDPVEQQDRPTTTITLNIPVDVMENLEMVAQEKEMSNAEALIQLYIGKELRHDLEDVRRKHAREQAKHILEKYHVESHIIEEVVSVVS